MKKLPSTLYFREDSDGEICKRIKYEAGEKDRGQERSEFLAFAKLDEQIHCLLRFLLDSGVQGEVLVGDANLGVISK